MIKLSNFTRFKRFLIGIFLVLFSTFSTVNALTLYDGEIYSKSVYVVNSDTEMPIVEKNINERRDPASLTEIMTFLVVYENVKDLSQKITVRKEALDQVDPMSSGVHLKEGEEISVMDLLHGMMISSSGACAIVLADYVGGGDVNRFVDMMNSKAIELDCADTQFANPDGIHNEEQFSTAVDMYKIAKRALKIPLFVEITSKCEYSCFGDGRDPMITTNRVMDPKRGGIYYCPWVKGIKTGYTEEAGRCLISSANNNGIGYIAVVMGGTTKDSINTAMSETKNIYTWAYENLDCLTLYPGDFPVTEVNIKFAFGNDKMMLYPENDFSVIVPKDADKNDIRIDLDIPEEISAPIKEGQIVGKARLSYLGEELGVFNLVSHQNYNFNVFSFIYSKIILHPIFLILLLIIVSLILFYIICVIRFNRRRRRRSKIKRFPKAKKFK